MASPLFSVYQNWNGLCGKAADANPENNDWISDSGIDEFIDYQQLMRESSGESLYRSKQSIIIGPTLAVGLAQTDGLISYVMTNSYCTRQSEGDTPNENAMWGIPSHIHGYDIYVEKTVIENKDGKLYGYEWPNNVALFIPTKLFYKFLLGVHVEDSEIEGFLMTHCQPKK